MGYAPLPEFCLDLNLNHPLFLTQISLTSRASALTSAATPSGACDQRPKFTKMFGSLKASAKGIPGFGHHDLPTHTPQDLSFPKALSSTTKMTGDEGPFIVQLDPYM